MRTAHRRRTLRRVTSFLLLRLHICSGQVPAAPSAAHPVFVDRSRRSRCLRKAKRSEAGARRLTARQVGQVRRQRVPRLSLPQASHRGGRIRAGQAHSRLRKGQIGLPHSLSYSARLISCRLMSPVAPDPGRNCKPAIRTVNTPGYSLPAQFPYPGTCWPWAVGNPPIVAPASSPSSHTRFSRDSDTSFKRPARS